ncbi:HAD-IIA family hydrolase [Tropheryma whipplei]|uniref:HAD-IIA family hydrolase n=1 Tax=Tropheryma whipplei TaxID=2039 RepID=UPI0004B9A2D0|nr:HAD-IIA family hydrolase [Tropheryma whipplei]
MTRRQISAWLTDMDGVLVRGSQALSGANRLTRYWAKNDIPFLVLTNNSIFTPRDLSARLKSCGLDVPEQSIWTSAMATAEFLSQQTPNGSAFVLGESGITTAMHEAGYILTDHNPDYVVLSATRTYSFEDISKAIRLILDGSRFITTSPDLTSPGIEGIQLGTGSVAALISKATNRNPYVVGKPNPMIFRSAMNRLGAHSESTCMIGDNMDTDILAGIEAGLHTILVLSGICSREDVLRYPYRPHEILDGVDVLAEQLEQA